MSKNINFKDYVECDEKIPVSEVRNTEEVFEDINKGGISDVADEDESSLPAAEKKILQLL